MIEEILYSCAWCEKEGTPMIRFKLDTPYFSVPDKEYRLLQEQYDISHGICKHHYQLEKAKLER